MISEMAALEKSSRDHIKSYIDCHVELFNKVHFKDQSMYSRLQTEGQFFNKLKHCPAQYPLQKLGYCFQNAYRMAVRNRELRYVEGIAYSGIPMHHAFNVDADNNVIDTTWRTRGKFSKYHERCEYYGIVIPLTELEKVMAMTGTYGFWRG